MVEELSSLAVGVGYGGVALVLVSAMLGGVAQSTVGFGAAFATVPALALVAPELLPGTVLVAMLPLTTLMAVVERRKLDRAAATRIVIARVPGILIGTLIVVVADARALTFVVGGVLLAAVAASALGWRLAVTPAREWTAGVISGVTGAATALGGPPLGLLYRDRDPAEVRPTLAVVWSVGIGVTLVSLTLAGEFDLIDALAGVLLSLAVLTGLLVSRGIIARVAPSRIRGAVLWWAGFGGVAAILRATVA